MNANSFLMIADALNNASVRFLVVGGLAVGAHGHVRYTNDVDLVIVRELESKQEERDA